MSNFIAMRMQFIEIAEEQANEDIDLLVCITALAFIRRPELMYKIFEHVNDDAADWIDKYLDELETYENSH